MTPKPFSALDLMRAEKPQSQWTRIRPILNLLGILAMLILFFQAPLSAQDTTHVLVEKSILTRQQLAAAASQASVDNIGKWVGLGREVGDAVNGSLSAISTQAVEFSKSDLGKVTVKVLLIKLIGPMIVHIVGGLLILLIGLPITVTMYFQAARKRVEYKDRDGTEHYRTVDGETLSWHFGAIMLTFLAAVIVAFSW